MKRFQHKRMGIVLILVLLAGCATSPHPLPIVADEMAKSFIPNPNAANVYIYDHHAPISQFNIPVVVDTQIVGQLGKDRYLMLELQPSTYLFTSVGGQQNPEFELSVESGKLYFLKQSQLWGAGHLGGAAYEQINESDGKRQIQKRQRVRARFNH